MVNDIVDKLRKLRTPYEYPSKVHADAADEIERLRSEIADLKRIISDHMRPTQTGTTLWIELREENQRLRSEIAAKDADVAVAQSVARQAAGKVVAANKQIDAAWERIHKPGFDPTSSAVILEGFKMLGIVRCEGCGGSGDVMDVDHPDPYAIKTCPDCNGRGWRKTCCQ